MQFEGKSAKEAKQKTQYPCQPLSRDERMRRLRKAYQETSRNLIFMYTQITKGMMKSSSSTLYIDNNLFH